MVMTNVSKPTKTKYINIDTKFRDEYNYLQTTDYNITLPERVTDVKTLTVAAMELPLTFYNVSSSLGNNSFAIVDPSNEYHRHIIVVPDGQYTKDTLVTSMNAQFDKLIFGNTSPDDGDLRYQVSGNYSQFYSNSATFLIDFTVNDQGIPDKYNFRYKLGWLLGFRNPSYTVIGTTQPNGTGPYGQLVYTSEKTIDLTGPRYLYLAIEEFNKGNQNSFISPIAGSFINKNIVARISVDRASRDYGTILPINKVNGLLISDKRSYTGKIDLLKISGMMVSIKLGQNNYLD
jgi:hypothetical protein